MKTYIVLFIFFLGLGVAMPITGDNVPNLQSLRNGVFTAGQPTMIGFDQLAAMGINTVINVLPVDECEPGEPEMVTSRNMKYFHLPFDPEGLNAETVLRFAELMDYTEKPVLIHCSTGNHVGGLWLAYRVMMEYAPLPQAVSEARFIGMQPAMESAVLEWLGNQGLLAKY
jgi:uncharacterized protein (TIGR01244 family)